MNAAERLLSEPWALALRGAIGMAPPRVARLLDAAIRGYAEQIRAGYGTPDPTLMEIGRACNRRVSEGSGEARRGHEGATVIQMHDVQEAEPMTPILLTRQQAADMLGVSVSAIKRIEAERRLTPRRLGRTVRYRRADIEAFADALPETTEVSA